MVELSPRRGSDSPASIRTIALSGFEFERSGAAICNSYWSPPEEMRTNRLWRSHRSLGEQANGGVVHLEGAVSVVEAELSSWNRAMGSRLLVLERSVVIGLRFGSSALGDLLTLLGGFVLFFGAFRSGPVSLAEIGPRGSCCVLVAA